MNTTSQTGGARLPEPKDFPVAWDDPDDVQFHWTRDCEHVPQPITPMFSTFAARTAGEGRARTVPVYEEAILARYDRQINTYNYTRLAPFTGAPDELAARARRNREKVGAVSARLKETWERQWKPELEAHWKFWADFDLGGADFPALAAHLQETLTRATRVYEIHYLMGPPMWFAIDEFETFYCDLFPGATPLDAYRLLQGFDNKTLEIGRALWRLSRLARASEPVRQALAERPTGEVLPVLAGFPEGQQFLAELNGFLESYGRRTDLWDWGYPSWEENPAPVINNLKNYLAQPDRDMAAELAAAAAEREAAVAEACRQLAYYPEPIVERFKTLLQSAQIALALTENHTYYIDFNGFGWVRRVIREFGKCFTVQGRLTRPDDVFYLKLSELEQMIADASLCLGERAASRRSEIEKWSAYPAPKELGTRPAEPLYAYSPDARRMARYMGAYVSETPPESSDPTLLRGQAGASGKVMGRARLILSLNDANRLQPGDILVTTTTAPPWTPLFLTASGLVTDAGGLLSHGAVVAREYHLPAVVGTNRATSVIADGRLIEVDGDRGTVRLLLE